MNQLSSPQDWSQRFGLALSPMFEREDIVLPGQHHVLLNGGYGSFGLSVTKELLAPTQLAAWAWSSNLPHHVAVIDSAVHVVRWDAVDDAQTYPIARVTENLDGFYTYLCKDRLRSNRSVVQHLVNLYGRIRSLISHAGLSDDRSIDAFLTVLSNMLSEGHARNHPLDFGLPEDAYQLYDRLDSDVLHDTLQEIQTAPNTLTTLTLHPSLAIRHAGGQLFQEAHFDLVRAPPPDMFGYVGVATSARNTRGGTHFTPPALARSIVDHTLCQLDDLHSLQAITVCDPACGSGAFLHEVLRGLRRVGYDGAIHIIGNDISAAAITMARFTLHIALRDWKPRGGATLSLNVQDSLEVDTFPLSDIIVMNPPFVSAIAQTAHQKAQLRQVVGSDSASRGDYSMAFVTKALESLSPSGVLGTIFPANLLAHKSTMSWRHSLASNGDIRLLASIGDFGLFSQALVHVACLVVRNAPPTRLDFTVLVTDNVHHTTADALRELRKAGGSPPLLSKTETRWNLFAASSQVLQAQSWRIPTPKQQQLLDALASSQMPRVGDLFDISQGVQTGSRKVFLLNDLQFGQLPNKERRYFRKVLMTDSIREGRIVRVYHLFFPHGKDGPLFPNEETLSKTLPMYYNSFLKPNEAQLRNRASIEQSKRSDWWGLMRPRSLSFDSAPRIISKFFGTEGSFVFDADAEYLPSTAHLWRPTFVNSSSPESDAPSDDLQRDVLRAYTALLNSRPFIRLLSLQSVVIAGGQYDLSNRFVSETFIPNLWDGISSPLHAEHVTRLIQVTELVASNQTVAWRDVDHWVAQIYGVPELAKA